MNSLMGLELSVTNVLLHETLKNSTQKSHKIFCIQIALNQCDNSWSCLYRNTIQKMKSFQLVLFRISLTLDRRYFGTFWDAGNSTRVGVKYS